VPEVTDLARLDRVLGKWDPSRRIAFCDEALAGESGRLPDSPGPWAILIGPEGGFSEDERRRLRGMDCASPISLGPRILRADTAAVAALTLWQSTLGDWE
jgi:16S rRNA (uracil1498-N3)-methyltransferase